MRWQELYRDITERILVLLEEGTAPWSQPWHGIAARPQNLVSKRPYSGMNVMWLAMQRAATPYWLTFNQARLAGGFVRKGERSTPIVFFQARELEQTVLDDHGEPRPTTDKQLVGRVYRVFNASQCDGVEHLVPVTSESSWPPLAACESLASSIADGPQIVESTSDSALYDRVTDRIVMPRRGQFPEAESFYATLFHELTHATGHASRLDRETLRDAKRFGDASYTREELVAEIGAGFLCGATGIADSTLKSQAAYL